MEEKDFFGSAIHWRFTGEGASLAKSTGLKVHSLPCQLIASRQSRIYC